MAVVVVLMMLLMTFSETLLSPTIATLGRHPVNVQRKVTLGVSLLPQVDARSLFWACAAEAKIGQTIIMTVYSTGATFDE